MKNPLVRRDWHYEIFARLIKGPLSSDAYKDIGCSRETMHRVLRNMKKHGAVHICRWERNHVGPPIAWYMTGDCDDATVPEPLSNRMKLRAYRARQNVLSGEVRIGFWGL